MPLIRLVEVEGGSKTGRGCTSAGIINVVEEFSDCVNEEVGVIGFALVVSEDEESSFTKNVMLFVSIKERV